ncbi:MAG: glutamine-hydrolyzing GMP synthase [Gammaproteobacteria bacterium]|nr:glutamine-hydrolyzing GMP synthase [Gammaproteobacteria bacterium]
MKQKQTLIILDYGSQYTQLLARRIRELQVYCEVHPLTLSKEACLARHPIGVILSGGPASVIGEQALQLPAWLFDIQVPVLGICYGMQAMAVALGGQVEKAEASEYGYAKLSHVARSTLLDGLVDELDEKGAGCLHVWMSHGDHVIKLPPDFQVIGQTTNAPIAAMAHRHKPWYALQFHPEVTHTLQGAMMLSRFVLDVCGATPSWTPELILEQLVAELREKVGADKVLLGLSGGVDSSVVAALLHRAIGAQLECVFLDTGLLRQGEVEEVKQMFVTQGLSIHVVDAKQRFLQALKGVVCPEEKRKTIGRVFIEVFEQEAKLLKGIKWLAQGTIYPDVIESAVASVGQTSHVIKSHHNVGGLPDRLPFALLEPIRTLFKDEVRQLGRALGLSETLVDRHPFPGPGLAVRVLGEVKEAYVDVVRQADFIFIQALREADLYHEVSQAFAVFLPVKSVGVMGDGRVYDHVICLRAVQTQDFMTANWAKLPWDFLEEVARRILNQVKGVSRVTYDISGKPPATIEWE